MKKDHEALQSGSDKMLREMLLKLQAESLARVRTYRRDQAQEAETEPADEMDAARSTADVETHASLIALAEERLQYLDEALARLEVGKYGTCLGCREAIPFARLMALPFTSFCVECESRRERTGSAWSKGTTIAPYDQTWTPPDEMVEAPSREYRSTAPEEDLIVRVHEPDRRLPKNASAAPPAAKTKPTKKRR
jgi:RNA polymerase-binding transcription factor DksA